MQREGFDSLWPAEMLAVRGYAEVLRTIPGDCPHATAAAAAPAEGPPGCLHRRRRLRLQPVAGKRLKRSGITTIHFVSPSIWAWRRHRMQKIIQSVSHILALYPFEPALYRDTAVNAAMSDIPWRT
jgi:lipid-A-disaccharide synthase